MRSQLTLSFDELQTPIGMLVFATDDQGCLRVLDWSDHQDRMMRLLKAYYGRQGYMQKYDVAAKPIKDALTAYFNGDLNALDGVSVATNGTIFQQEVWAALRSIKPGATLNYAALAAQIGRPKAVRAVGLANGANPIGIVVPCHRVIGSTGALTGYGGGLHRKQWLLDHERGESQQHSLL